MPTSTAYSIDTNYSTDYIGEDPIDLQNNGPRRGFTNQFEFVKRVKALTDPGFIEVKPLPAEFDENMLDEWIERDGGLASQSLPGGAPVGWTTLDCESVRKSDHGCADMNE
jgi:hypothetical protein